MRRRGHGRPLGTTTRVRMRWGQELDPQLGEVTVETDTDRYYRVVGVEELRDSPAVWMLVLERIAATEPVHWEHSLDRRPR